MIIKAENLSKQYIVHKRTAGISGLLKSIIKSERAVVNAVNNISFTVEKGEIIGFVGPNGAGKSTTIKMITGILLPTSGMIETMAMEPFKKRKTLVKKIGIVMGHRSQLWWNLPLMESFELIKAIYKIPNVIYQRNINLFVEIFELENLCKTPIRQMSLGQRVRAELAASLLHDPELVLLDEPTIGLDVVVKERLREIIKKINKEQGTTFLLTTHDMNDVEKLCQRVICIDKGKIIYNGDIDALKNEYNTHSTIVFRNGGSTNIDFGHNLLVEIKGDEYRIKVNKKEISQSEVAAMIFHKCENVMDFKIIEPTIEEIFKYFYNQQRTIEVKHEAE